ncbi:MAG TPA: hypothetical protein VJ925_05445 [Longimicrobiales bacterium]|nr:hypothetical protein [Longimicrobiales bacterium]
MRVRLGVSILSAWLVAAACSDVTDLPPVAPPDGVSFVVFGDQPYTERDVATFPGLVAEVNETGVPFVIHVGDIKAGGDACTDAIIVGRRDLYRGFDAPMVFTPGDNEWTDCHRAGGDPLERLTFLRDAFYIGGDALPLPDSAVSQAQDGDPHGEFVENLRWVHDNVVFATAHVVGSDNAREGFDGRTAADDAEVERREAAVTAWVEATFAEAERIAADAVVIAAHADVRFDMAARGAQAAPFQHFLQSLERSVLGFDGPVLLLQGDTHSCLFDQPRFAPDREAPDNFWRLRVPGGGNQTGWLMVTLRPDTAAPVSVTPRMLRGGCSL